METIDSKSYKKNPDQLFDTLVDVVGKAGFNVKRVEKAIKRIEVSTGVSLFSFGETLEIIVGNEGDSSLVYVRSKTRIPWNITAQLDKKIKTLFQLIDESI